MEKGKVDWALRRWLAEEMDLDPLKMTDMEFEVQDIDRYLSSPVIRFLHDGRVCMCHIDHLDPVMFILEVMEKYE